MTSVEAAYILYGSIGTLLICAGFIFWYVRNDTYERRKQDREIQRRRDEMQAEWYEIGEDK